MKELIVIERIVPLEQAKLYSLLKLVQIDKKKHN